MANNPYVNKVQYGNQTLMDLTEDTVTPEDVAEGVTFHDRSGAQQTGTGNYYSPNDTAETDIQDGDYFPFYDSSASGKRKSLWSNIKAKLKTYFDGIYQNQINTKASITLLDDTVGWDGRNVLKVLDTVVSKTESGATITVTRNSEGEVTEIDIDTNGSPTSARVDFYLNNSDIPVSSSKSYKLSGCTGGSGSTYRLQLLSSDSSVVKSCENSEVSFDGSDFTGKIVHSRITIYSGTTMSHVKFYPMLRDFDAPSTFQPYHESVEDTISDVYGVMGENGARNYCDVSNALNASNAISANTGDILSFKDLSTAVWSSTYIGKIYVETGKRYLLTTNDEEGLTYGRIGMSNSATEIPKIATIPNVTFHDTTYSTVIGKTVKKCNFTSNFSGYIYLWFCSDENLASHATFDKGFICKLPEDTSDNFSPHAMTNRELTEKVGGITVKKFTTDSFSVAPNTYETKTFDITNGSLHALGIVGYSANGTGNDNISFWREEVLSDTQARIGVKNTHASATSTITADIYVLYIG